MNSGSEKKLSMDELMALNQPVQTAQSTPQPTAQEPTPPPEAYPTKEEWEDLVEYLYTLGYHAERQAGHQKKISESLAQLPTRAQMDELLKAVKRLEEMAEQAGKKKEKRFSIPSIRLPKLHLPESDWPTVVTILMALAVLFLMWWAWGGDWSSLSLLDLLWTAPPCVITQTAKRYAKKRKRKSPSVRKRTITKMNRLISRSCTEHEEGDYMALCAATCVCVVLGHAWICYTKRRKNSSNASSPRRTFASCAI